MRVRAGFSLVETVVAAVLLSVAALSVAGGGAAALRAIAAAERQHGALTAGTAVLDSLAQRPAAGTGSVARPPFVIDWAASDTAALTHIRVTVRTAVPPHDSILTLSMLCTPAPLFPF